MSADVTIVWFRQDLRLDDNPSLRYAIERGTIIPVFILDDINAGADAHGAASRAWLKQSLASLNESLKGHLLCFKGAADEIINQLVAATGASAVVWNRCYEHWRIQRDSQIKNTLQSKGVEVKSFNGSLLWEPWEVSKADGTPYRVFTPFYRKGCLKQAPREPFGPPEQIPFANVNVDLDCTLDELLPNPEPRWDQAMLEGQHIGEIGARERLGTFLNYGLARYANQRDLPSADAVSKLSPHLHFGEISPNRVWYEANRIGHLAQSEESLDKFLAELGWREFSYSLLYYNPTLPRANLSAKFDKFPWQDKHSDAFKRWQTGQTGIPIIDAGMRELWQTGTMHNRVRMVVASFLVKNLLIDWRHGAEWFWDCLTDADLASNSASWQWIAGCGADAAPYFRIFNPVTQGQKFDKEGHYVRKFVPELANVPEKYLHSPWEAPSAVLAQAGVLLGKDYPKPIVDLKASRQRALDALDQTK